MQFIIFSEILLDYLCVCSPKYSIEYLTFWEILEKNSVIAHISILFLLFLFLG